MDETRIKRMIEALRDHDVIKPCPRCESTKFDIVGESSIALSDTQMPGEPVIPTVVVACSHCGFITQHAATYIKFRKMELAAGWLGRFFGSGEAAPIYIAGVTVLFVLAVSMILSVIFSFTIGPTAGLEVLKVTSPIVTMILGFLFGKRS